MIVEKIPSPMCDECGSYCVILTDNGFECDDCKRITAQISDLSKIKNDKLERTLKNLENINEII